MLVSLLLLSSCLGGNTAETTDSVSTAPRDEPFCILTYDVGLEPYPIEEEKIDYGGYEFKILNSFESNDMCIYLDPDMTGEILDDCCFERNLIAENKFNILISEERKPYDELADYARSIILADEALYDAMYIPINELTPLISENLFHDLLSIDELHIENIWWDQQTIIKNILDDKLFFATSDLHAMAFERSKCMFFNEDMLMEMGLSISYEDVFWGNFTFDLMKRYCSAVSDLNYSIAVPDYAPSLMADAMQAELLTRDDYGRYQFTADSDKNFKSTWNMLKSFFGENADKISRNGEEREVFKEGRSLFLIDELNFARELKNSMDSFGILPLPKYDKNQETYEAPYSSDCLAFCIPRTNDELERTGVIVDYLTYESYAEFMPRYYDVTAPKKSPLREYVIDVLALLRGCRSIEAANAYGWYDGVLTELDMMLENNTELDDVLASHKEKIVSAIEKTYNEYPE